MPGLHGQILLAMVVRQIDTMGDTRAVGDDDRDTRVTLSVEEGFQRVNILGAVGDLGDIDVFVVHGDARQILFPVRLAAGRKLGDGAAWRGLGVLAAGVGIDLGIEDENIDVLAR